MNGLVGVRPWVDLEADGLDLVIETVIWVLGVVVSSFGFRLVCMGVIFLFVVWPRGRGELEEACWTPCHGCNVMQLFLKVFVGCLGCEVMGLRLCGDGGMDFHRFVMGFEGCSWWRLVETNCGYGVALGCWLWVSKWRFCLGEDGLVDTSGGMVVKWWFLATRERGEEVKIEKKKKRKWKWVLKQIFESSINLKWNLY